MQAFNQLVPSVYSDITGRVMTRILIVDDQNYMRATLVAVLRANGFEALGVEDANTGLREFTASHFDLAIVDIYMPNVDGVKLIKALRERSPSLPIIAMSGVQLSESQRTALDFLPKLPGLSEIICLQKPFRLPELLKKIRAALAEIEAAGT
jgi:DNA-binding response OmpR family regulator